MSVPPGKGVEDGGRTTRIMCQGDTKTKEDHLGVTACHCCFWAQTGHHGESHRGTGSPPLPLIQESEQSRGSAVIEEDLAGWL